MSSIARRIVGALWCSVALLDCASCQGGGGGAVAGNDQGSDPINDQESTDYKKALVRCYKTGGSRIVKIMGELRCY